MKRRLNLGEPLAKSSPCSSPEPPRPSRKPVAHGKASSAASGSSASPTPRQLSSGSGESPGPSQITTKRARFSPGKTMNFTSRKLNQSNDSNGHFDDASDLSGFESTTWLPEYDVSHAMVDPSLPGLIDTHCHMDFIFRRLRRIQTFEEFKEVYASTFPKCFIGMVSVFCDPRTWLKFGVEEKLESASCVRVTYGCHPHFAEHFDQGKLMMLKELLLRPNVVALGEIGLDYSEKNTCDRLIQMRVFAVQLKIALKKELPICLHIREAIEDGFKVLKESGVPSDYPLHVHCFNGEWGECQRWLTEYKRSMIGITMLVAREGAKHIHEVVSKIPLGRLVLETDAPYFIPPQVKADAEYALTNMSLPGHVIHAAAQIAQIRQLPLEKVLKVTTKNATALYGLNFKVVKNEVFDEDSDDEVAIKQKGKK